MKLFHKWKKLGTLTSLIEPAAVVVSVQQVSSELQIWENFWNMPKFGMNRNVQNQKFLPTFIKPASQMKLLHFSDSARNSSVYFLLSFIFLLTGEFFYIITLFKSCKRIFVFFSGISFVLGGNNYKTRKQSDWWFKRYKVKLKFEHFSLTSSNQKKISYFIFCP